MDLRQAMAALAKLGNAQARKTWLAHGAPAELSGVRIGERKGLLEKLRCEQELALELRASDNLDAKYLAGLVADGKHMPKLEAGVRDARWGRQRPTTKC